MATEVGLPSFAEYCQGFLQGCTLSQIPALDAVALPLALRIQVNTLSTVRCLTLYQSTFTAVHYKGTFSSEYPHNSTLTNHQSLCIMHSKLQLLCMSIWEVVFFLSFCTLLYFCPPGTILPLEN